MSQSLPTLVPRVAVGSLCSPLEVGADRAPQAARDLSRLLQDAGCEVVDLGPVDTPDKAAAAGRAIAERHLHAVAFAAASWFEDYLVLDLLEECRCAVAALGAARHGDRRAVRLSAADRLSETAGLRTTDACMVRPPIPARANRPSVLPARGHAQASSCAARV